MPTETNELAVWNDGAPVVTIGDAEFAIWNDGAPVVDVDEGAGVTPPTPVAVRRRATIF